MSAVDALWNMKRREQVKNALAQIEAEYWRAKGLFPADINSEHEGYAVLLEEVDELKAEVWKNQRQPERIPNIRKEAIQVAAMAIRLIVETKTP